MNRCLTLIDHRRVPHYNSRSSGDPVVQEIVNYSDGDNWTDLGRTLDELAGLRRHGRHGPVLTKQEFLKHRDKVAAMCERLRALSQQGVWQEEITQTLLKEFNYGTGPGAGQIAPMMRELK
jgi:hypothetical protein